MDFFLQDCTLDYESIAKSVVCDAKERHEKQMVLLYPGFLSFTLLKRMNKVTGYLPAR